MLGTSFQNLPLLFFCVANSMTGYSFSGGFRLEALIDDPFAFILVIGRPTAISIRRYPIHEFHCSMHLIA